MTDWKTLLQGREVVLALPVPFEVRVEERSTTRFLTAVFARDGDGHALLLGTAFDGEVAGASPTLLPLLVALGRFAGHQHYDEVDLTGVFGHGPFEEHLREASLPGDGTGSPFAQTLLSFDVGHSRAELVLDKGVLVLRGLGWRAWHEVCSSNDPEAMLRTVAALLRADGEAARIAFVVDAGDLLRRCETEVETRVDVEPSEWPSP